MSAPKTLLPADVVLNAYARHKGNKTAAADELGIHRTTFRNLLALYGVKNKPVAAGSTKALKHNVLPLPEPGKVFRYILTSAQNNTKVFTPFLINLKAYAAWLGDCQIMVSRFCYNKARFANPKSQKPGKVTKASHDADLSDLWFDSSIEEFVCDDPELHGTCRWQLAPDLFWCAEMQISPTTARPLADLSTYTGEASSIFPHTKIAVEAVPSMPGTPTKHIYSTGTVTGKNYIQKKAGLKAQFHHEFGAVLVEVNSDGDWWLRHLSADSKGEFYDVPRGQPIKVSKGEVTTGHRVEAINWGDTHRRELPKDRMQRYWGAGGVVDMLRPKHQFHNDILSFRTRSHHEMKSLEKMLQKYLAGEDRVDAELLELAEFLSLCDRADCVQVVVCSNHDRHGERWLDEANYRHDLTNVEYFLEAQLARVKAIKAGEEWSFLEWAARRAGCPESVIFLKKGQSFKICNKTHPIECGLHGDIGPNGTRGSTANLSRMGAKVTKGHDHSYTKRDAVWSAGTCSMEQGYNEGQPTTWSVTHILSYPNSKRTGLTERAGMLWAA